MAVSCNIQKIKRHKNNLFRNTFIQFSLLLEEVYSIDMEIVFHYTSGSRLTEDLNAPYFFPSIISRPLLCNDSGEGVNVKYK